MRASSSENLSALESSIGYTFKKKAFLKEAMTHKSFAHEQQKTQIVFNERMEFLGDAVLELVMSEFLYCMYQDYTEADLSKIKAYAVQESTLADIAQSLSIGDYLKFGKGEELTGGRRKPSLLANAYEALLAAIYLDGGYKKAKNFVLSFLTPKIEDLAINNFLFDFKTKFQEVVQAQFGILPKYITHREEGPEHKKIFEVNVFINDDYYGSGKGKTKKAAAQKAAEAGLKKIREQNETDV
jgi:ribonuclease-3